MGFHKASTDDLKVRLAIAGPPGSGKTYSSLLIAAGISQALGGEKIAMIDTERGSGSFYGQDFSYDIQELGPPFSPARYIAMINDAQKDGYKILIIDSISHCWAGEGGVLDMHAAVAKNDQKATFTAWRSVNPHQAAFVDSILTYPGHVICTMRSKMRYELVKKSDGKFAPVKVGECPIQRDGIQYEFTTILEMTTDGNTAFCDKDRTGVFQGLQDRPTMSIGKALVQWTKTATIEPDNQTADVTIQEVEKVIDAMRQIGVEGEALEAKLGKPIHTMDKNDIHMLRKLYKAAKASAIPGDEQ